MRPIPQLLPALTFGRRALLILGSIMLLASITLVGAILLFTLHHNAEVKEFRELAQRNAYLVLNSFEQTVAPIDAALLNFDREFSTKWNRQQVYQAVRAFNLPNSIVLLSVVDRNGKLVATSSEEPDYALPQLDLSDREHIRVHMDGSSGESMFISKPVLGRVSKQWTIQFTRALHAEDGSFAGVVVASFNIQEFLNLYSRVRTEPNALIALIGFDGIVRARASANTSFGGDVSGSPTFKRMLTMNEGTYETSSVIDGIDRIGYFVRSPRYPIIVVVAFDKAFVWAQTNDFRHVIWVTFIGLFLMLAAVAVIAARYIQLQDKVRTGAIEASARQREVMFLHAIGRVPGVCVIHVTVDGVAQVGEDEDSVIAELMVDFVSTDTFRATLSMLRRPLLSLEHFTREGQEYEVQVVIAPLEPIRPGANPGAPEEVVVFALDQTSQRIEANKLYQMSKLASLGEVATGLAHEINQPLGVIRLAAANALTGLRRGLSHEHMESKLNRILQQTIRMSRIIDHMRIFGRTSDEVFTPSEPTESIEGALQVVGAQLRLQNINVKVLGNGPTPSVMCRQDQLEQVLINLLQNAADAINEKRARDGADQGLDTIELSVSECRPEGAKQMICIRVKDNAGGVPDAVIEKVFQPFFTTKPVGKGTGLGLSVSFGIIRDHGGTLSVENDATGAVFTIALPAAPRDKTGEAEGEREASRAFP
ncbi:ATP-binding protein [Roseixanthobacter glucoisosaccharinicivorans]|uniref:ATP-binding protein n=1 Tax=Roseixanthobacter glucoisosaccharinicivorans TaxID=3119923 RepID=UPI0037269AB7